MVAEASKKPVLIIGGPTASGKSGLALSLARQLKGTVINADSMQIYEGLPILTAQPDGFSMTEVPHRLYNLLPPDSSCSAAQWRNLAIEQILVAHQTERLPIIVGGTGFYMSALMQGLSPIPEVPAEIRSALIERQKQIGTDGLFQHLERQDPETASRIDRHNTQRVIRALEVLEYTGQPLSVWQDAPREGPPEHIDFVTVTLLPTRDMLYQQCNDRFIHMLDNGMLEEVAAFKARGLESSPLFKSLGYPELSAMLDGEMTKDAAIEAAQAATRHYAKRQMTWFRNQTESDLVLEKPDAKQVVSAFKL